MSAVREESLTSYIMSRIKGKDTKPEILVRKYLFSKGFRFRLHVSKLPGKPDIVLAKYMTVIFVNGCFWHGHESCKLYNVPKKNTNFWLKKVKRNKERDALNISRLAKIGWKVQIVWECELKPSCIDNTLENLTYQLSINIS